MGLGGHGSKPLTTWHGSCMWSCGITGRSSGLPLSNAPKPPNSTMPPRGSHPPTSSRTGVRHAASWLALVALTSLGSQASTLCAEIRLDDGKRRGADLSPHRLIVQVFPDGTDPMTAAARPRSSVQRAVTLPQLRRGVAVQLIDLDDSAPTPDQLMVVAWVEPGQPDDIDPIDTKPPKNMPAGTAKVDRWCANVKLTLGGRACT